MATRWHYRIHGRDVGPVDFSTLQTMAAEERLFADDEIRPEDSDQWILAETVAGLFTESADADDLSSMLADSESTRASDESAHRDVWYCRTRSDELGPMPFGRLVSLARDGKLARRDQVRHGMHGNWVEARSIEGLFEEPGKPLPLSPSAPAAADAMMEGFEIVSEPAPAKPKGPRPPLEPILRMEDDVTPVANVVNVPDTEAEWTCRVLGQEIGPIPWSDMRELVELRQLGPNDRVRKGQSVAWVPAGTIDNLFPKRKKKKPGKKKKLSDDEVMDFLQDEEDEEEEVSSHLAPQRSFSRSPARSSPAMAARSSPAMPVSRPEVESPQPAAANPTPPPPRPDLAAALAAASAASPKPLKPKREKRPMGNPFAGLGDSLGGIGERLADAWKPIAGVAVVLLVVAVGIYGGGSLFSSSSASGPSYYPMTVALWHEAQAFRTSKNQKAWVAFGQRYKGRVERTLAQLSKDESGDAVNEVLLECYRDYLPKMIEAPIDAGDDAWQKMEEAMKKAESLR